MIFYNDTALQIRDKIYGTDADISSPLPFPLNVELQTYPRCVVNVLSKKTTLNWEGGGEGCRLSGKIKLR